MQGQAFTVYDGSSGVSYGHQLGLSAVHIARPLIHPLDMNASLEAVPGC